MFFSISKTKQNNFSHHHELGPFVVNTDPGWEINHIGPRSILWKGYYDCEPLRMALIKNMGENMDLEGNFCLIVYDHATQSITIQHNTNRSFPLSYNNDSITNLYSGDDYTRVWADTELTVDSLWNYSFRKLELDTAIPTTKLTMEEATNQIEKILTDTIALLSNTPQANLKLFCSGGIDTLVLYALLKRSGHVFELIKKSHYEFDYFTTKNRDTLKRYWGYDKQIHHWIGYSWLVSGSHGDEYLLRGPTVIGLLTAWHDIDFLKLIKSNPDCYHYHYFLRYEQMWQDVYNSRHQLREQFPTRESLNQEILNILLNDHQYWHLGGTLTYTPFKNIKLVKILLQCDINDLLPQFLDATISKELVNRVDPYLLESLSQYKNVNSMENLTILYDQHVV